MANEFIARKGLIALESSQITGSLNVSGGITGSLLGTSSWATNAISSSLAVQNLITASVSLNTITFTKGDGTTFPIVVNTGSGGAGDNLGNHTATQDLDMATFNIKNLGVITGSGNAQVSVGRYNFGFELISAFPVTGSGLIVSSSNLPANHYNMVKVGNIELIDLNSGVTPNTFVIHNVDRLLIASGSEPVDIFTANNKLIDHNGSQFDVYTGGSTQTFRVTSGSSQFNNFTTFAEGIALKAASANLTHLAGWTSAPTLPTSDLIYLATSSLILPTSSIRNFPTEVSRSAAADGFGSGGGGGVTINNNVDNYLVTATGTANTLNGEVGLQYSSSILINAGKSRFGGGAMANTTHQFKGSGSDTYAGFLIQDPDAEDIFKVAGSMANSDLLISIGDVNDAYGTTKIEVDDPNSKINLKGKVYGTAYATNATALGTNGTYDIGSRLATSWAVAGGPTLTAGRIVYLSGSTQWAQAQANTSGSSYGMLGVVTDAGSQNEILIQGTIQISGSALTSGIAGQPVYLSALAAGQVTLTAPSSSGHVVRTLGYIYKANSNIMYFNPDNSYIVRT